VAASGPPRDIRFLYGIGLTDFTPELEYRDIGVFDFGLSVGGFASKSKLILTFY
jgi:hypothetical protein